MMKHKICLVAVLLIGVNFSSSAQSSDNFLNSMNERINSYYLDATHDNLFMHTDRSVYFPGDNIFFRAYVTDAATLIPSERSNQCILMLVNDEGNKVYNSTFDLSDGGVSGKFQLPENLEMGVYKLFGFVTSNRVNSVNKVFTKIIFLADPEPGVLVDFDFGQKTYRGGENVDMEVHVYGSGGRPSKNWEVKYTVKNETSSSGLRFAGI